MDNCIISFDMPQKSAKNDNFYVFYVQRKNESRDLTRKEFV